MKRLKFAEHLVNLIMEGQKNTTWRINDEKDLSIKDIVFCCRVNGEEFAQARIISVKETTFKNLAIEDKKGHEEFASDKEMYETYSNYYRMKVTPQTKVKIIKFQLIK